MFNLVLSGGGVRSYAHIGVYKYLYERGFDVEEVVSISGGSIIAPFIFLQKHPNEIIELFKKEKIHKKLFPAWFIPDKFEFLLIEPSTYKLGEWVELQFSKSELNQIHTSHKLHIMATRLPQKGQKAVDIDMLTVGDLKNSIAASTAISGVFKSHKVKDFEYIDGGHWNNSPIFFDFLNLELPLYVSNLGYTGQLNDGKGRISKLIMGFEIAAYARLQDDIKRWNFEKKCGQRKDLMVINPKVWDINSLNFNLSNEEIDYLIKSGYEICSDCIYQSELFSNLG